MQALGNEDWSVARPTVPGRYRFFHPFSHSTRELEVQEVGGALFARRAGEHAWVPLSRLHGLWSGPLSSELVPYEGPEEAVEAVHG